MVYSILSISIGIQRFVYIHWNTTFCLYSLEYNVLSIIIGIHHMFFMNPFFYNPFLTILSTFTYFLPIKEVTKLIKNIKPYLLRSFILPNWFLNLTIFFIANSFFKTWPKFLNLALLSTKLNSLPPFSYNLHNNLQTYLLQRLFI